MSFDPNAYKRSVKEEWGRAAKGWHAWIPAINAWLENATEMMLDGANEDPELAAAFAAAEAGEN